MIRELGRDLRLLRAVSSDVPLCGALVGDSDASVFVMLDPSGALWSVAAGSRVELVRWCLLRRVLSVPTIGELVAATDGGRCVGLLPRLAPLVAVPFGSEVRS